MKSTGEGLDRASHVKEVELILQGDEHINGLVANCRSLIRTHLAGIEGLGYKRRPGLELVDLEGLMMGD